MKDPSQEEKAIITIQRYIRGWLVRRKHSDFFRKIKYRKYIIREIINFEQAYINKLGLLVENLKKPLLQDEYRSLISREKVEQLFSNIEEILELHQKILSRFTNSNPPHLVGKIYTDMLPLFTIYFPYVKNYNNAFKIYSSLVDDEEFSTLIEVFGYLPSYLILPIQQTPRYVLLFSDLLKHTNPQNQDFNDLSKLIDVVRSTASSINECITSNDGEDEEHHLSTTATIKRPASASSKGKPRNSISMHKKAIDSILSSPNSTSQTDYSHLPSYLRPTQASNGWSRPKVDYSPQPKWRSGGNADAYHTTNYVSSPFVDKPSPLFIDRSTPNKNQPAWRPSSPAPKSFNFPREVYTRSTKVAYNRPVSPPPKPNFYAVADNSSNTTSPTGSSSPSHTPPPTISSSEIPLGKKHLSDLSLTPTTSYHSDSPSSTSTTPPISPCSASDSNSSY